MLRVDETVEASVNQAGQPIGFSWRGQQYTVISPPVRWFARREWWVEAARVNRGIGANVLELEMWRCQVRAERAGSITQFELNHVPLGEGPLRQRWQLMRVYQ